MDKAVVQAAGRIRHEYGVRGLDAIHMAIALAVGAKRFITNDKALAKLNIPELRIEPLS